MHVLLLGGTAEARSFADAARADGVRVTTSVAGRTAATRAGAAGRRVGGFGGATGLEAYLATEGIDAVVDATHPFADGISANAMAACVASCTPLLRLVRPSWASHPDASTWQWVSSHTEAARAASGRGRVLLTVGRQSLDAYRAIPDVVARVAEAPDAGWPSAWTMIATLGPFTLADELTLLRSQGIRVLVSKDSGGSHTSAKLDAAREQRVDVVMIGRPDVPPADEVSEIAGAIAWIRDLP